MEYHKLATPNFLSEMFPDDDAEENENLGESSSSSSCSTPQDASFPRSDGTNAPLSAVEDFKGLSASYLADIFKSDVNDTPVAENSALEEAPGPVNSRFPRSSHIKAFQTCRFIHGITVSDTEVIYYNTPINPFAHKNSKEYGVMIADLVRASWSSFLFDF